MFVPSLISVLTAPFEYVVDCIISVSRQLYMYIAISKRFAGSVRAALTPVFIPRFEATVVYPAGHTLSAPPAISIAIGS